MRILISPLDWGLGHATRCIPLINSFLHHGCTVFVACNATQQSLLEKEFDNVKFIPLAGYNIRYASSKRWFAAKILQQIPKIILAIRREHHWLKKAVKKHRINLVISDNRFGFYHKKIPSVFITHQLSIQTPFKWLTHQTQKINYRFINRFNECWVPDYEGEINLAGILSHPEKMPFIPLTYIGLLSRFEKRENESSEYKWLIILSGPEPQRTLLEKTLIDKFSVLTDPVLFVRGLPSGNNSLSLPEYFTVVNHMSTTQLEKAFSQSEYIISRSGYTTVMDVMALQKKSLLVPTPGQTEQEYLARHLAQKHWCIDCSKPDLLLHFLENIERFNYKLPRLPDTNLNAFIREIIYKYGKAE